MLYVRFRYAQKIIYVTNVRLLNKPNYKIILDQTQQISRPRDNNDFDQLNKNSKFRDCWCLLQFLFERHVLPLLTLIVYKAIKIFTIRSAASREMSFAALASGVPHTTQYFDI